MVLLIIIPTKNGYFIGGIPHFQTSPSIDFRYKVVPQFGIAELVNITPIKPMVYGRYNELVFMGFINQLITGGHHPVGGI